MRDFVWIVLSKASTSIKEKWQLLLNRLHQKRHQGKHNGNERNKKKAKQKSLPNDEGFRTKTPQRSVKHRGEREKMVIQSVYNTERKGDSS